MNKLLLRTNLLLFPLIFTAIQSWSQCNPNTYCQQDVLLTSQAQVDAFCQCRIIEGNLRIGINDNNNIQDLSPLDGLKEVNGEVFIAHTQLKNLRGLGQLNRIGANLVIRDNPLLENVDDLNLLTNLPDALSIINNPQSNR